MFSIPVLSYHNGIHISVWTFHGSQLSLWYHSQGIKKIPSSPSCHTFVTMYFGAFILLTEPSTSPRGVTITRPSPTAMVVSWIPLSYSEARGFISHYTVAYIPLARRQALDTMTQTVPGMDTNTTRIEGLDVNTDYIALLSATNGAGTSQLNSTTLSSVHVSGIMR